MWVLNKICVYLTNYPAFFLLNISNSTYYIKYFNSFIFIYVFLYSFFIQFVLYLSHLIIERTVKLMIPAVRQQKILEILSSNEIIYTDTIMNQLDISVSTLRRDLIKLENERKITLLHGGGVRLSQRTTELNIITKIDLNKEAKDIIARKAITFVEDGDVIFMDPSSTTYQMIPYLSDKKVTVLTNGISHINQLVALDIPCVMIGGNIKTTTNSCIGPLTESIMNTFYFNKSFLGASGFSIQSGITNHDMNERTIKVLALKNSTQSFFLLDHTKYGTITMVKVAELEEYPILTDKIPSALSGYSNIILCE